jgi:hypothetical protein
MFTGKLLDPMDSCIFIFKKLPNCFPEWPEINFEKVNLFIVNIDQTKEEKEKR